MEKEIKKVLNTIEKNGFEAYIIGGYVRDLLLGRISHDVDICTNALPKDLINLFPDSSVGVYGAVSFKLNKFNFEITTYRKEQDYSNRHPGKVTYINNLLEDIERRDFRINTICMNQNGNIIDLLNSSEDLKKKIISPVGNPDDKINDDPLRILRAIRFATVLDFKLDDTLVESIKKNRRLINQLSDSRIIDEMTKILISANYKKGLKMLKDYGILDILEIDCQNVTKTNDVIGMWAQLNMKKSLAFNKETIHNIDIIRKIVSNGNIDRFVLYKYGLYLSMVAGEILNISNKKIASEYAKMPIKGRKDLNVTTEQIMNLLNIKEGEKIGLILNDLEKAVLSGHLRNLESDIKKYLIDYYGVD